MSRNSPSSNPSSSQSRTRDKKSSHSVEDDIQHGDDICNSCTGITYFSKSDPSGTPVCYGVNRTLGTYI